MTVTVYPGPWDGINARLSSLEEQVRELVAARQREPRGVAALAETERKLTADLAKMGREFCTPEDETENAREPSRVVRPVESDHLDASPEVGAGDAPQGQCNCGHRALLHGYGPSPFRPWSNGPCVSCRCDRWFPEDDQSAAYCAICDGDALPVAVRLKGGGFVCEGCVVP